MVMVMLVAAAESNGNHPVDYSSAFHRGRIRNESIEMRNAKFDFFHFPSPRYSMSGCKQTVSSEPSKISKGCVCHTKPHLPNTITLSNLSLSLSDEPMTKSRKRKAATASGLHSKAAAWRDVTVSLGDDGNNNNNNNNSASVDDVVNDASFYEDKNHYDDPALLRSSKDLEAVPGEQVAMFYGLQVIDGSQYTLTETNGTTQFRIVNEHEDQQAIDAAAAAGKDNNDNEDLKSKKSNKKGHGKVKDAVPETIQEPSPSADVATDQKASKKRKKKKKRSKKKDAPKKDANETTATATATSPTVLDLEQIQAMQNSWMVATAGVTVHERLCASLLQQEFWTPTPIQAAVLPAAVLGRRNIVGAAPTGSGKTLAFLLPIFQYLLLQKEEAATANDPVATTAAAEEATTDAPTLPIQALILTPTRELALQIHNEAEKLCKGNAGLITGGFAHAKQFRVLEKNRPAIIVATPGRLWELVRFKHFVRKVCVCICRRR